MGRRSEAAAHPFRATPADDGAPAGASARPPTAVAGNPLVLAIRQGQREVVYVANAEALALGLAPGTPITQARALVAELVVEPADVARDAALLGHLAEHATRHWTPIAAADAPDGLLLDLTGASHLFGGEDRFCRRLVTFCTRVGLTAIVAIAETPGAAYAVARSALQPVTIVPAEATIATIAPLPVEALRLDADALMAARRFGLERIADLLPLPRGPLARRLGRGALQRLDQALGRIAEPIAGVTVIEPPRAERRLLEPIGTPEAIAQVMADAIGDLVEVLRARGLGARSARLALGRVDGSEQIVTVGLARASRDTGHLKRLFQLRLDTIDPGLGIEVARIVVTRAEPLSAEPLGALLAGPGDTPNLAPLVDQLAGRIGHRALFRAHMVESDVPERAVARVGALASTVGWPPWRRPARLLARPEPLHNVIALLPDHPPRRFFWRGETHEVVAGDGPERIHGEWWVRDGEVWAVRDYFRVEDSAGARFWVFRRGDGVESTSGDMSWWLHGAFG